MQIIADGAGNRMETAYCRCFKRLLWLNNTDAPFYTAQPTNSMMTEMTLLSVSTILIWVGSPRFVVVKTVMMLLLITAYTAQQQQALRWPRWCDGILTADEEDNDLDGYVACSIALIGWDGADGIIGGDDCNNQDATVYPTAAEVCDGQYNDCIFVLRRNKCASQMNLTVMQTGM